MTQVESANDVVHLHNIEQIESSLHNTTLGSRVHLFQNSLSTPSSAPFSAISNSLVIICKCKHAQASNARFHWLDGTTKLEMSTLAPSTFVETIVVFIENGEVQKPWICFPLEVVI